MCSLYFKPIHTFLAKLKSRTSVVKWIPHSFNRFNLSFVSMSFSLWRINFHFLLLLFLLFLLCGIHSFWVMPHCMNFIPLWFTSLPPPTLCDSIAAHCSMYFAQELASTFCAIKCSHLSLTWELEIFMKCCCWNKMFFWSSPLSRVCPTA